MWSEDVDDSEFIIGGLVYPQKAYIKEFPTGWKPRYKTYEECKKGKTMDSAKKSVEKILEISKKHGYACVVGFRKQGYDEKYRPADPQPCDTYCGATGTQKEVDTLMHAFVEPMYDHYKDGVKDGE